MDILHRHGHVLAWAGYSGQHCELKAGLGCEERPQAAARASARYKMRPHAIIWLRVENDHSDHTTGHREKKANDIVSRAKPWSNAYIYMWAAKTRIRLILTESETERQEIWISYPRFRHLLARCNRQCLENHLTQDRVTL